MLLWSVSDFVADAKIQVYIRETIIITWLIALTGYLIIVLNAPLEHHNKKLTIEQKEKYMIVSAVLGIASMLYIFYIEYYRCGYKIW